MRLPEEQDERGPGISVIYTIVAVSVLILIILAYVFISNSNRSNRRSDAASKATPFEEQEMEEEDLFSDGQKDIETLYKEHKLKSEDLDFWDMYGQKDPEIITEPTPSPTPEPTPEASHEPTDEEKAADGKHILISYRDGTEEWIEIDEDLPTSDYDFTKMKTVNGKMTYYSGNKKISRLGVEISEDSGNVDFEALREEGIDFVIIRVGARGYGTGLISLDKNFTVNMEAAVKAGMEIGVSFDSQAVTVEEVIEEVQFVAANLIPYRISYPVALRMESITNDLARTDILDVEQKTQMVETFLREMESEGYQVILYGDKGWLLSEILSSEILDEYDVWLTDQNAVPDYPYQFKMWEYAAGETLSGVEREVNYTISFVDYTKR